MDHTIQYEFQALMWQHEGAGGWYFISLPEDIAYEIRNSLKWQEGVGQTEVYGSNRIY